MTHREKARIDLRRWSEHVFYDLVQDALDLYPDFDYDQAWIITQLMLHEYGRERFRLSAAGFRS